MCVQEVRPPCTTPPLRMKKKIRRSGDSSRSRGRDGWSWSRVELLEGASRYTTTGRTQTQRQCAFGNYGHVNVKNMCQ